MFKKLIHSKVGNTQTKRKQAKNVPIIDNLMHSQTTLISF